MHGRVASEGSVGCELKKCSPKAEEAAGEETGGEENPWPLDKRHLRPTKTARRRKIKEKQQLGA